MRDLRTFAVLENKGKCRFNQDESEISHRKNKQANNTFAKFQEVFSGWEVTRTTKKNLLMNVIAINSH